MNSETIYVTGTDGKVIGATHIAGLVSIYDATEEPVLIDSFYRSQLPQPIKGVQPECVQAISQWANEAA